MACPRYSFLRFWRSFGYNEGSYFVKHEIGLLEGGSLVSYCINLSEQQCINLSERYRILLSGVFGYTVGTKMAIARYLEQRKREQMMKSFMNMFQGGDEDD